MAINVIAIVQARMGSTRLPGKVLKQIDGKPLIEILLSRLSHSKKIDKIILATSIKPENDPLVKTVEKLSFEGEDLSSQTPLASSSVSEKATRKSYRALKLA